MSMRQARFPLVATLAISLMATSLGAVSSPQLHAGSLDPRFGAAGRVLTDFRAPISSGGQAVAVQRDGKIVVAGTAQDAPGRRFALTRYNTDGTLDQSFGTGGMVTTRFADRSQESVAALALQTDGKIIVAGTTTYTLPGLLFETSDFAIARYNADGTLDPSFGDGGTVTTNMTELPIQIPPFTVPSGDNATGVAVQPDGRIVVAGNTSDPSGRGPAIALARYNEDGSLDHTFGPNHDGKVASGLGSASVTTAGVAIAPTGKIFVAGSATSFPAFDSDFALVRYNADGTLDLPFGVGGLVTTDLSGMPDFAGAIAIQADGRIVVAGTTTQFTPTPPPPPPPPPRDRTLTTLGPDQDFAVVRYNADGTLDTGFGAGGKVITDVGSPFDAATSVAIGDVGRIVVAGSVARFTVDFAVAVYGADGRLDPGFGGGAPVVTDFAGDTDRAFGVAVANDHSVIAVGSAAIATGDPNLRPSEIALARYLVDGSLDSTFDADGTVMTLLIGSGIDEAEGVALQPDGKVVVAGNSRGAFGGDFALIRYNADGSIDSTFGPSGDGRVVTDLGSAGRCGQTRCPASDDVVTALVLQPDRKIVVAGATFDADAHSFQFALVRYLADGTLDSTFGTGGIVKTDLAPVGRSSLRDNKANGIGLQRDGKIIVVGSTTDLSERGTGLDWALARYNADGSLDPTFGPNGDGTLIVDFGSDRGIGSEQAGAVAIRPDGEFVVAGSTGHGLPTVVALIVAKFARTGTLDASVTSDFPFLGRSFIPRLAIGFTSDGSIVVMTDVGFDVFQYTRGGDLDTNFGVNGVATMEFDRAAAGAMAVQSDGHIVLGGTKRSAFVGIGDFALARYRADGSVDTSFGDGGTVTTNFGPQSFGRGTALALRQDGDIVLVGGQNGDFAVAKYLGAARPAPVQ